jgi:hypothetical protein
LWNLRASYNPCPGLPEEMHCCMIFCTCHYMAFDTAWLGKITVSSACGPRESVPLAAPNTRQVPALGEALARRVDVGFRACCQ